MFDSRDCGGIKEIKAKGIQLDINFISESATQQCPFLIADAAFKDGILDPLAEIQAGPGHTPQAFPPGAVHRVYIIGYQHNHYTNINETAMQPQLRRRLG
jgi:hypothetical protein